MESATSGDFDLILADVLMPTMDGYEFARRIKADERTSRLTVLAVTALAMVGDRERALQAGFDGYIPKPIDPETFVREVDAFLDVTKRSVRKTAPAADARATQPRPAPSTAAEDGPLILVVDDIPANIAFMRAAVEPAGFRVSSAASMNEALAKAYREKPKLIITDVHMPAEGGFELVRAVKADEHLRDVPVLLVSSTSRHEMEKAHGLALGAANFLVRPIDPQALVREVRAALGGS